MTQNRDLLDVIIKESESYNSLEKIEEQLQNGMTLVSHPVQPLYMCMKSLPAEVSATYLDRFSAEQRQLFLDIDLWQRDNVNPVEFEYWIKAYSSNPDEELRHEFIFGPEFLLYLKSRVNIWTFDSEDPIYPDHDNYFLTEDNQLLIEFHESYEYVTEIRQFIRDIYSELGVDKGYAYLFKLTVDSHMLMEEEEYRFKKGRLEDVGFVDYYDALAIEAPFQKVELIDSFIKRKVAVSAKLDDFSKNQVVHNSALVAYKTNFDGVHEELSKVDDKKREDFLSFNFIRMVNASLTLNNALKDGPVAMTKVGKKAKATMLLGFSYVKYVLESLPEQGVFSLFEFTDLYKIGHSLITISRKRIKNALRSNKLEDVESFLGRYWNEFLDSSFDEIPKFSEEGNNTPVEITSADTFLDWSELTTTFEQMAPFNFQFNKVMEQMKSEGSINDNYYLNYGVDDIDLEAILISYFANYTLGTLGDGTSQKMGLTAGEFRTFISSLSDDSGAIDVELGASKINEFADKFGLSSIYNFTSYFKLILKDQLEGYDYKELSDDDLKHVGGPIILAAK